MGDASGAVDLADATGADAALDDVAIALSTELHATLLRGDDSTVWVEVRRRVCCRKVAGTMGIVVPCPSSASSGGEVERVPDHHRATRQGWEEPTLGFLEQAVRDHLDAE